MNYFKKESSEEQEKYKSSDDYVKPRLFDMYFEAHHLFADNHLSKSFRLLAGIFTMIYNREFTLKDKLYEDTRAMMLHFNTIITQNRTPKLNEQIKLGKIEYSLQDAFMTYLFEIGICLDELGVLLRTNQIYNDLHKELSMQNFGEELSLYQENKKELNKNLSKEDILEKLSPNMIYRIHALWRYENAIQE